MHSLKVPREPWGPSFASVCPLYSGAFKPSFTGSLQGWALVTESGKLVLEASRETCCSSVVRHLPNTAVAKGRLICRPLSRTAAGVAEHACNLSTWRQREWDHEFASKRQGSQLWLSDKELAFLRPIFSTIT